MNNYEPMRMTTADLEHFPNLFYLAISGIETHLEDDEPDKDFIIESLLALSRQLDLIAHDVVEDYRKIAAELIKIKLGETASEVIEEAV